MNNAAVTALVAILVVAGGLGIVAYGNVNSDDSQPERIGIVGAMDCEVNDIKKEMTIERTEKIADMDFCIGKLAGHDVVVVKCGMGKVNAGICAQTLISQFNVKAVINSGAAGSLDSSLRIGDFIISVKTAQHDYDVSAIGFEVHEIPYTGKVFFEADEKLRESALKAVKDSAPDAKVLEGLIATGDLFISEDSQKISILADFPDAKCCEMEGGAIAQTCYLNGIPFVIIRAISDDTSGEQFIDHMEEIGRESANAVIEMIKGL